jgi:hypothetical protein
MYYKRRRRQKRFQNSDKPKMLANPAESGLRMKTAKKYGRYGFFGTGVAIYSCAKTKQRS